MAQVKVDSRVLLAATIDQNGNFHRWHGHSASPELPSCDVNFPGRLLFGLPGAADEGGSRASAPPACQHSRVPVRGEGRIRAREKVLEAELVAWARQEGHHVLAPDLAMMLWSLAAVECKNAELVHALTVRANEVAKYCTSSQLAMIWQALADLKAPPRASTVTDVLNRVESIASQFTIRHAKQTVRAIQKCGVRKGNATTALKRQIAKHHGSCTPGSDFCTNE